jgi:hypothetical protein
MGAFQKKQKKEDHGIVYRSEKGLFGDDGNMM